MRGEFIEDEIVPSLQKGRQGNGSLGHFQEFRFPPLVSRQAFN